MYEWCVCLGFVKMMDHVLVDIVERSVVVVDGLVVDGAVCYCKRMV